jgi:hypothetical protein
MKICSFEAKALEDLANIDRDIQHNEWIRFQAKKSKEEESQKPSVNVDNINRDTQLNNLNNNLQGSSQNCVQKSNAQIRQVGCCTIF